MSILDILDGFIPYASFFVWLLNIMFIRFIPIISAIINTSINKYNSNAIYYSIACHNSFICASVDKYLGCFQPLALMNKASVNIFVYTFSRIYVLVSLGYMPSRVIGES